jgi:hypothetical protein
MGKKSVNKKEEAAKVFDLPLSGDLSAKLQKLTLRIELCLVEIKINVYNLGKHLSEAKTILSHGRFQRWIEETFGRELPYPTAALYKSIYEYFQRKPELVRRLPLTLLMTMKEEAFPEEVEKLIEENPDAFKETDGQAFREAYKQLKEGRIDLDRFFSLAKLHIELGTRILAGETMFRQSRTATGTVRLGLKSLHDSIHKMTILADRMLGFFPSWQDAGVQNAAKLGLMDTELIAQVDRAISALETLKKRAVIGDGFFTYKLSKASGMYEQVLVDCEERRKSYTASKL